MGKDALDFKVFLENRWGNKKIGGFYKPKNHPNFSDKYRELAAVACLIGQANTGLLLKAHINGMLNVGWQKPEIIELFIFLIGYAGFPACVDAIMTLKQVIEENS